MPQQSPDNPDAGSTLQTDLGSLVHDLAYTVDRGVALLVAPYELTPIDVRLLLICRQLEECTATQLACLLPVDAGRISRVVNGLVGKDLLSRQRQRDDRRVIMLRLTPHGQAAAAEIDRILQDYFAKLTDGLTEQELRAFAATANRIVANHQKTTPS